MRREFHGRREFHVQRRVMDRIRQHHKGFLEWPPEHDAPKTARAMFAVIELSAYHLASAGIGPCLGRMTPRNLNKSEPVRSIPLINFFKADDGTSGKEKARWIARRTTRTRRIVWGLADYNSTTRRLAHRSIRPGIAV